MPDKHHYVSRFHLQAFVDPDATTPDPWLWVGRCKTGEIDRRSPKNLGWARGLFEGSGCLGEDGGSLEQHLAEVIEGPASMALRRYLDEPQTDLGEIPPEVTRYLAWAAARSLPMLAMMESWQRNSPLVSQAKWDEPPLFDFGDLTTKPMQQRLQHPDHGVVIVDDFAEIERMLTDGWSVVMDAQVFPQLVHAQAVYFMDRHFPRLRWFLMRAPEDKPLILGDRPVIWEIDGDFDLPPNACNHPRVRLFAPLTPHVALSATHREGMRPVFIRPEEMNAMAAFAAHEWVVGSTISSVEKALAYARKR